MKRFVWRLQKVLELKTKEEQTKRTELLKITEKLAQKRYQLLSQRRIMEDIISGIAGKETGKRLPEQEFFLKHSIVNNEQIKELEKQASKLESQQRQKMSELLEVKRFKEGLEKLRAEAKSQFISHQEKLEQKGLDEMAGNRFSRKKVTVL